MADVANKFLSPAFVRHPPTMVEQADSDIFHDALEQNLPSRLSNSPDAESAVDSGENASPRALQQCVDTNLERVRRQKQVQPLEKEGSFEDRLAGILVQMPPAIRRHHSHNAASEDVGPARREADPMEVEILPRAKDDHEPPTNELPKVGNFRASVAANRKLIKATKKAKVAAKSKMGLCTKIVLAATFCSTTWSIVTAAAGLPGYNWDTWQWGVKTIIRWSDFTICARPTICTHDTAQTVLLIIARVTAYSAYPGTRMGKAR